MKQFLNEAWYRVQLAWSVLTRGGPRVRTLADNCVVENLHFDRVGITIEHKNAQVNFCEFSGPPARRLTAEERKLLPKLVVGLDMNQ